MYNKITCPACNNQDYKFDPTLNKFECQTCGYTGNAFDQLYIDHIAADDVDLHIEMQALLCEQLFNRMNHYGIE